MKIFRLSVVLTYILLLIGCSTASVNRTQGISVLGKSYVETLKKVNDLALDNSIEFTANQLPLLERDESTLSAYTDEIKKRVENTGKAHDYLDGLTSYFSELETLSKGDQSDATSKALEQIADSLKAEPINLKLSDEKKIALSGFAGYVATQFHSVAVNKALIRDADTVARALAISERMLDLQIQWINSRENSIRDKKYNEDVKKPYVDANKELGSDWKKEWSNYVRTPPVILVLSDAKKSSQEMQKGWINVLRGQYSAAEIQVSIKNVTSGIEAISALKDAK